LAEARKRRNDFMDKGQCAALAAICVVAFLPYFILRADLVGADSYYFASAVCGKVQLQDQPPLAMLLFSLMPCSIPLFKLFLFSLMLCAVFGIAQLGNLFSRNGWLAGLFAFLSPLLVYEFAKFENDAVAFAIVPWILYFFYRGTLENKVKYEVAALALAVFAASFWFGAAYYAIAMALSSIVALMVAVPMLVLKGRELIIAVLPNLNVFENMPFIGIIYLFILPMGFATVPMVMIWQFMFFYVLLLINAKFSIHIIPFLAVGFMLVIERFPRMITIMAIMSFTMAFVWGTMLLHQPPTPEHWDAIDYAICLDKNVTNSWGLGYWVLWRGGIPSAWGGGHWEQDYSGKVVVVQEELLGCEQLNDSNNARVYRC